LRRPGCDAVLVRQTTGRAILFCALSSAIGFGSLTLASNGGISSLGAACALGLGSMMLVSLVLLPLWRSTSGEERPRSDV
ncbi:MAG: MMPL family transporter, partial [Verrucomicrobiales bacterium]|nr:MMPL family transporter [Verrucomicrobiales bacterium]